MPFSIPGHTEALARAIRVSQAVNRVRHLPTVFVASPLLATFTVLAYWERANHAALLAFAAVTVLLWTPTALSWRRLRNRPRPADVSPGNEVRALIFSVIAGLLWAAVAWTLFTTVLIESKLHIGAQVRRLRGKHDGRDVLDSTETASAMCPAQIDGSRQLRSPCVRFANAKDSAAIRN